MNIFKRMKLKSLLKKAQKYHALRVQGGDVDLKREIDILQKLAMFYEANRYDKKLPHAYELAIEYYRAAATLGSPSAQYLCGKALLEQAKFWTAWGNGLYGEEVHKQYARELYQEAFKNLNTAAAGGHVLAKRLHGMAYIHGWGLDANPQTGYQYVLDSIEMENAWGKATKIFDELKLNSPEFFAALRQYQAGKR